MEANEVRQRIVDAASRWLGTPFCVGSRARGAGIDCSRFVLEVFKNLRLVDDVLDIPVVAEDYGHHNDRSLIEEYLNASDRFVKVNDRAAGDVITMRWGRAAHHCGIRINSEYLIHAVRGKGVCLWDTTNTFFNRVYSATYRHVDCL